MRKWKYGTQSLRSGNPWLATTSSLPSSRDQPKFLPTLGTYQNWSLWVHTTYIPKDIVTSLRYVKDDKSIWRQRPPCPYSHPADHKEGLPLQRKRMDHSSGEVIYGNHLYCIHLVVRIIGWASKILNASIFPWPSSFKLCQASLNLAWLFLKLFIDKC